MELFGVGADRRVRLELDDRFDVGPLQQRRLGECRLIESIVAHESNRRAGMVAWLLGQTDLMVVIAGGVLLLAGWGVHRGGGPDAVRWALLAFSAILTSLHTFSQAVREVRRFRVNVDVLMFVAAAGAAYLGHAEEGALLLFLFGLGHAGEDLALGRARNAIESLTKLSPDQAIRLADGVEQSVPIEVLKADETILVRPFDRVAVDAVVLDGTSELDESSITGESIPVTRKPGEPLLAGTINGGGRLTARVSRPASDSTLARIVRMVEEAQNQKSPTQRFTDRIEAVYVPAVFVTTILLVVLLPTVFGVDWGVAFYRSMAFLTAASPCALAIGTPAAVLCGIARAARIGVLIKGGAHLETLGRLRAIAFDKTGTLTAGRPQVEHVVTLAGVSHADALRLASAVEIHSQHPLASAIVDAWRGVNGGDPEDPPPATDVKQLPGLGTTGVVGGAMVTIGKASLCGDVARWPVEMRDAKRTLEQAGCTTVTLGRDGAPIAIIGLLDQPRESARRAIRALSERGLQLAMLTGDHRTSAAAVASKVGLGQFHADLLPQDKLQHIDQLRAAHGTVAMIGDGVNDAPALARADLGIAMGAAGAAVAMETADVVLMGHDLSRLDAAIHLGRRARRIVLQNLFIALGVIAVVAPLAALGYASLGPAVLLHEGSTIVVVLNALRLLRSR
jgi:Zn2+/Cd2+-exporting ATPase